MRRGPSPGLSRPFYDPLISGEASGVAGSLGALALPLLDFLSSHSVSAHSGGLGGRSIEVTNPEAADLRRDTEQSEMQVLGDIELL
jgi:hypothetical protein